MRATDRLAHLRSTAPAMGMALACARRGRLAALERDRISGRSSIRTIQGRLLGRQPEAACVALVITIATLLGSGRASAQGSTIDRLGLDRLEIVSLGVS